MLKGKQAAVYVAATRQHVGKTSTCLGLLQGLTVDSRVSNIGFLKPVGQQSVQVESYDNKTESSITLRVDKDVAVAKEVFNLKSCDYRDMSPVVIPRGYTKNYLDGKISLQSQLERIHQSYDRISSTNDFTVVEGTGHTGVGSIVGVNNARIAKELGLEMILIANGGIGSAFDDLALNLALCRYHDVRIKGVILNKVLPEKVDMMWEYFPKALSQWESHHSDKSCPPLIGVVPNLPALENPCMADFESLFRTKILSQDQDKRRFQTYSQMTLVTSGLRRFLIEISSLSEDHSDTLFVTHASRNDIILGFLSHWQLCQSKTSAQDQGFRGGLILTGVPPADQPQEYVLEMIQNSSAPILYVPLKTFEVMEAISNFTAKFDPKNREKVLACGEHYAKYIDFDYLLN